MKVFVRHSLDTRPAFLGDMPLAIDSPTEAIKIIKSWGIVIDGDCTDPDLFGQFVYEEGEAYFEVVIAADED